MTTKVKLSQISPIPATNNYIEGVVANLVNSAPETLDTLNELAAALGDDPNFATTISNEIGNKLNTGITVTGSGNAVTNISDNNGDITVTKGNTFLPLSGDTMTGAISLSQNQTPIRIMSIKPTEGYTQRYFTAYDTDDTTQPVGSLLFTTYADASRHDVRLRAHNNGTYSDLAIGVNSDGSKFTIAPTPPTSSNDTNIATTAYVKSNLSSYLPLSGGTMTGSINYSDAASWNNYMDSDKAALSVTRTNGLVTIFSGNTTNQRFALITYPGSISESYQDWISLYSMPKSTFDSGSYDGSNATTALKWNAATGELYSGNVSTSGKLTISGNHGYMNKGLILTGGAQNFAIQIQNNGVTKGTAPSSQTNSAIDFYGATMDKYQNRLANIESRISTNNVSTIALRAYNTTSAENTGTCEISCNVDASGNAYTVAPTPATADNSTKIATTAFVKAQGYTTASGHNHDSTYLKLSGGTTTGSIQCVAKNLGSTYVNAAKDTGAIVSMTNTDSFGAWLSGYTKSYKVALATYPGSTEDVQLYSITKANVTAGTNTTNKTLNWNASTGALTSDSFVGALTGNVTGNCSGTAANVTGTVAIANGGTGATTRLNALKALTQEDVGTNATYFLTITNSWGKGGYTSVANAKTVLGLKSAAYTESSAYATSGHTHSTYAPLASPALTGTPTAPTAALGTNTTQIATTAFVTENAQRKISANTTIFVSYDGAGTGDGSSAANALSLTNMWKWLAVTQMYSSDGSYTLTIKFVPRANQASYGNITFDANKMPGIRTIVIDTSTGTNSTTSNFTTNSPVFGNIYVRGSLAVTLKNIESTGVIAAQYDANVALNTYVGAGRFEASYWGYMSFGSGTYNLRNYNTGSLFTASTYGNISINTATAIFNFRELCYYTSSIFTLDSFGRMYNNYSRTKLTGTQPVVSLTASGTLSGTSETAAGTAAKVLTTTAGNTTLANGTVIYVKFTNTNTANNPTLNVDGTGAKPIYFGSTNIPGKYINKDIQYKLTYNTTYGAWVCNNQFQRVENIAGNSYYTSSGTFSTTYNSGSWNWTGFSRNFGNGSNVNAVLYSSTAAVATNTTQVATTAFVQSRLGNAAQKVYALTNAATITINPANGTLFTLTPNRNSTITIDVITSGIYNPYGGVITLFIPKTTYVISWNAKIKWMDGSAPDLSSGYNILTFATPDGGTTYYGNAISQSS